MKILIMNDNLLSGGAEIYAINLKNILTSCGNDVSLLTFENEKVFNEKLKDVKIKENIYNIQSSSSVLNKLIFNMSLYRKIRKFFKKLNPDLIILNSAFISPITQLKALKGYKCMQVVHDYSIVCPKLSCIKGSIDVCSGYKFNKCLKECDYHNSKLQLRLKYYLTKRMETLRKKYIIKFITPSKKLKEYMETFNYNVTYINNPVEIKHYDEEGINIDKKLNRDIKQYIYVGGINKNKGTVKLIEEFNLFSKNKNVELKIYGSITEEDEKDKLKKAIDESDGKVKFLRSVPNDEVVKEIVDSYSIVVPSILMDNYPTTVLEGFQAKTLVIGSNRGGIPEMLDNKRGIVFDITKDGEIQRVLEESYLMDSSTYEEYINKAYNYVISNNSFEKYKERFNELIKNI